MSEPPEVDVDAVRQGIQRELDLLLAMARAGSRAPSGETLAQREVAIAEIGELHRAHAAARSQAAKLAPQLLEPLLERIRTLAGQVLAQDQAWLRNLQDRQQTVRERQALLTQARALTRAYHRQQVNRIEASARLKWPAPP